MVEILGMTSHFAIIFWAFSRNDPLLMQVSMQLAIKGVGQLLVIPEAWQLEQVQSKQVVWVPVTTLMSLGCAGDG